MKASEHKKTFSSYLNVLIFFPLKVFLKLATKLSKTERYSVIIVHTLPEVLVFVSIFQKLCGAKIVLDARDLSVELSTTRLNGFLLPTCKTVLIFLEKLVCTFCDKS